MTLKYPPTKLTVAGGQWLVSGVQFEFTVPRDLPIDWALVETRRAELVNFTGCAMTIRNASFGQASFQTGVAFFDVKATPGTGGMTMNHEVVEEQVGTIHLQDCVARGEAVFLRDNDLQPVRLIWDNGLLATSERMIVANGGPSQPRQAGQIQVQLRHVTAMIQGGLALLSNSQDAPYQLQAEINCDDCILVSKAKSPLIEEGKSLLEHLANSEFMNEYFQYAIWGPVLKDQEQLKAFDGSNTVLNGLLDLAKTGTAPAYPDVFNAAYADMSANFLIPKLAQRVVVDGWDFDKAIAEAQTSIQAIYYKY